MKQTTRKYYKYVYEDWEQPVLTSDTSSPLMQLSSTSTYGGYYMYQAFDNNTSSGWLTANGTGRGSLRVQFKDTLFISKISVTGWTNPNGYTKTVAIYDDLTDTNLVGETQTFNGAVTKEWEFSTPITTDKLSFFVIGSGLWGCIGEIKITAQARGVVESTSSDYDFYEDSDEYICKKIINRKYYKYTYNEWTRPNLTENGIMHEDTFAVSASNEYSTTYAAWKAVNGTNTNAYDAWYAQVAKADYYFYNPNPLNVTKLTILNRNYSNLGYLSGNIYGSNDYRDWSLLTNFTNTNITSNSSWEINLSNNTDYYKYYKIEGLTCSTAYSIGELGITATQRTAVESTSSDYDFYKDTPRFHCNIKINRGYYKYLEPVEKSLPTYQSNQEMYNGKDDVSIRFLDGNFTSYPDFYKTVGQTSSCIVPRYSSVLVQFGGLFKLQQANFNSYVISGSVPDAALIQISGVANNQETILFTGTINRINPTAQITNDTYYEKYIIYFNCGEPNIYGGGGCTYFNLSGLFKKLVESDASDYDFYVNETIYNV